MNEGELEWFITPLFDQAKLVSIEANSILSGYRLRPGVHIEEETLLSSLYQSNDNVDDISNQLSDYTNIKCSVQEALKCLATDVSSVTQVAKELGVSSNEENDKMVLPVSSSPQSPLSCNIARLKPKTASKNLSVSVTSLT